METAEGAVLDTIEHALLTPEVLDKVIARAEVALAVNTSMERRSSLEREITQLYHELKRLSAAVAAGGELTSLIEAVKVGEARREELRPDLASLTLRRAEFDAGKLRQQFDERLADWRGLLRWHPVQGQQVLERLIDGRLTFEPTADGEERYYRFTGTGTVEPLLAGQVVQKLASPTGKNILYQVDLVGEARRWTRTATPPPPRAQTRARP